MIINIMNVLTTIVDCDNMYISDTGVNRMAKK